MLRLLFVGDCMMMKNDPIGCTAEVSQLLQTHDYCCCNFEGPIVTGANPFKKIGPSLEQIHTAPKVLRALGFQIACLANNHIYDGDLSGLLETITRLNQNGIVTLGVGTSEESVYAPLLIEENGEKIAIFNAAENGFGCIRMLGNKGYAWILSPLLKRGIVRMKELGYFVIVISHAGLELCHYPLPEWKAVYEDLIDMGAKLVIAHHPHVVQGWETYQSGQIYFSLGNFIWQDDAHQKYSTIAVSICIENGTIAQSEIHYIDYIDGTLSRCTNSDAVAQMKVYSETAQDRERLEQCIDKCAVELMGKSYPLYYCSAFGLSPCETPLDRIKNAMKIILRGMQLRDDVLYHNIGIETHNWTYQRILRQNITSSETSFMR